MLCHFLWIWHHCISHASLWAKNLRVAQLEQVQNLGQSCNCTTEMSSIVTFPCSNVCGHGYTPSSCRRIHACIHAYMHDFLSLHGHAMHVSMVVCVCVCVCVCVQWGVFMVLALVSCMKCVCTRGRRQI